MRVAHNTIDAAPLTNLKRSAYIPIIERAPNKARDKRNITMATSIFRTAFERIVAARERQASRYVNGALMSLDDQTLKGMGTSREELRRKGAAPYVF